MKFTLARFNSLTRALMQIGGTVVTVAPHTEPVFTYLGAATAVVGVIWGQFAAKPRKPRKAPENPSNGVPDNG